MGDCPCFLSIASSEVDVWTALVLFSSRGQPIIFPVVFEAKDGNQGVLQMNVFSPTGAVLT